MSLTTPTAILAGSGTLLSLATVATTLRLYSRRVQKARFGPDDWIIVPAWILFVAQATITMWLVQNRMLGYTMQEMAAAGVSRITRYKILLAYDVVGCVSEGLTRISALLFIRRIFCASRPSRRLESIIWAGIALLILWMITFITLPLLQCGPNLAEALASPLKIAAHKCNNGIGPIFIGASTISSVIIEALIIVLPIPLVLGLHTSLERRLSVLFVFATAFLSLGASMARAVLAQGERKITNPEDINQTDARITFLFVLGSGTALVAVNLPSIYWVLQRVKPEKLLSGMRSLVSRGSWSSSSSLQKSDPQSRSPATMGNMDAYQTSLASSTEKHAGIYKSYTIDVQQDAGPCTCPIHNV